jgi:hypothetical protein
VLTRFLPALFVFGTLALGATLFWDPYIMIPLHTVSAVRSFSGPQGAEVGIAFYASSEATFTTNYPIEIEAFILLEGKPGLFEGKELLLLIDDAYEYQAPKGWIVPSRSAPASC